MLSVFFVDSLSVFVECGKIIRNITQSKFSRMNVNDNESSHQILSYDRAYRLRATKKNYGSCEIILFAH